MDHYRIVRSRPSAHDRRDARHMLCANVKTGATGSEAPDFRPVLGTIMRIIAPCFSGPPFALAGQSNRSHALRRRPIAKTLLRSAIGLFRPASKHADHHHYAGDEPPEECRNGRPAAGRSVSVRVADDVLDRDLGFPLEVACVGPHAPVLARRATFRREHRHPTVARVARTPTTAVRASLDSDPEWASDDRQHLR